MFSPGHGTVRTVRNENDLGNVPRTPKRGHQAVCTTVLVPNSDKKDWPDGLEEADFEKRDERQTKRAKKDPLVDENAESDRASWEYFKERDRGFVRLHSFLEKGELSVGLFGTVNTPRELVVIKRFKDYLYWEQTIPLDMPREFKFNTLQDSYPVSRHLWLGGELLPVAYTHAFAVRDFCPYPGCFDEGEPCQLDASFWSKYYNGGTLGDFAWHHMANHIKVPEIFIWHVIAELGRALAYLHTGTYHSRKYNIDRYMDATDAELEAIKLPTRPGWKPIAHFDNHNGNIWLHYPSEQEKAQDPRLQRFSDELPQVVLGDFGLAINVDEDNPENMPNMDKTHTFMHEQYDRWGMPERFALKDKCLLGEALKMLLLSSRLHPNVATQAVDFDKMDPLNTRRHPRADRALEGYSASLKRLIARFQPIIGMDAVRGDRGDRLWPIDRPAGEAWGWRDGEAPAYNGFTENVESLVQYFESQQELGRRTGYPWEAHNGNWPTFNFIYGTMIAMADVRVARYLSGTPSTAENDEIGDQVRPRPLLDTLTISYPLAKKELMLETFDKTDADRVTGHGHPGQSVKDWWPTGAHQFITVQYDSVTTGPALEPEEPRRWTPSPPPSEHDGGGDASEVTPAVVNIHTGNTPSFSDPENLPDPSEFGDPESDYGVV